MATELTGRRRFQYAQTKTGKEGLVLQVEYSEFNRAECRWVNKWRLAVPADLAGETIVGLPDQGS